MIFEPTPEDLCGYRKQNKLLIVYNLIMAWRMLAAMPEKQAIATGLAFGFGCTTSKLYLPRYQSC